MGLCGGLSVRGAVGLCGGLAVLVRCSSKCCGGGVAPTQVDVVVVGWGLLK